MWRNYNQALQQHNLQVAQQYVNKQKDLAASQATAPLQQQIAGLNQLITEQQGQITKLNAQIQADATALVQATSVAHTHGLEQGAGIGVVASLLLYGIFILVKRLTGTAPVNKPQARAASAS